MRAVRRAHALARPDSVDHTIRMFQEQSWAFSLFIIVASLMMFIKSISVAVSGDGWCCTVD